MIACRDSDGAGDSAKSVDCFFYGLAAIQKVSCEQENVRICAGSLDPTVRVTHADHLSLGFSFVDLAR